MIKIETSSFIPIYEQIKKEFKSRISLGILKKDEALPSIRDLAAELIVNPNTVARAYRELEMEGFIYTRQGKGSFVADDSSSLIVIERDKIVNQIFDQAIEEARKFHVEKARIAEVFEERLRRTMKGKEKGRS